jgi:hypothetical protein
VLCQFGRRSRSSRECGFFAAWLLRADDEHLCDLAYELDLEAFPDGP